MKNCPVFVSSADVYSDLWFLFFDLFKKNWPEYTGDIYLNTEEKQFRYEGLNIKCTNVGKRGCFGKTFRAGLEQIESSCVLLIMVDYLFMGKVNDQRLQDCFRCFQKNDLDSLCLFPVDYTRSTYLDNGINIVIPPSKDMFSLQSAFWKKQILREMVLPHENPWLAEWYGTRRANVEKIKLGYTTNDKPIPYFARGALHSARWNEPIVPFLKKSGYEVDFSKRGIFIKKPVTLFMRAKGRVETFIPRYLSNLDLLKRKYFKK